MSTQLDIWSDIFQINWLLSLLYIVDPALVFDMCMNDGFCGTGIAGIEVQEAAASSYLLCSDTHPWLYEYTVKTKLLF